MIKIILWRSVDDNVECRLWTYNQDRHIWLLITPISRSFIDCTHALEMEIKTKKTFLGCLQHFHAHAGNGSDILCVIFFVDDDDDDDNDTGDCSG